MSIGERLRKLRGDRTQLEISLDTGISVQALSNYENGTRIPRDETKVVLANYYNVSIEELFFANWVFILNTNKTKEETKWTIW